MGVKRGHWRARSRHELQSLALRRAWPANSAGDAIRRNCALAALILLTLPAAVRAQTAASAREPASQPDSKGPTAAEPRTVSWKKFLPNLAEDQRSIWTFPAKIGRHWQPTVAFTGATAGLIALDPHDAPYFRRTSAFDGFNQVFSGATTALGIAVVPTSFYLAGLKKHDAYAQESALFSAESLADGIILDTALKAATRRERPSAIPPSGNFSNTWFKTGWGSSFSGTASFPSAHSTAAFAVATVMARRYRTHRWVPWVSYGLAGLVAFSRVTTQAHFPSDVFVGVVLGYSISRFAVLLQ